MFDLGFIGFGNIAQALANGLSSSNYSICTYDIQKPKRNTLRALNVTCLTGNEEVVVKSKIIFLDKDINIIFRSYFANPDIFFIIIWEHEMIYNQDIIQFHTQLVAHLVLHFYRKFHRELCDWLYMGWS